MGVKICFFFGRVAQAPASWEARLGHRVSDCVVASMVCKFGLCGLLCGLLRLLYEFCFSLLCIALLLCAVLFVLHRTSAFVVFLY
jgi:hypothetical protein